LSVVEVSLGFDPRPHQREAHANRKRFSCLVWHRRAGKTVFSIMELLLAALDSKRERARYGYVAPFFGQAKAVAWTYLAAFARKVPETKIKESELSVEFANGAVIRLFGADNPDSLRGLYFDGVVLDEVADMKSPVWGEILRPALTDREGFAIFIGTPKGVNLFSKTYYDAIQDPDWYADLRRAADTGAISDDELVLARKAMTASQWAQEMECDFAAAVDNVLIPLQVVLEAGKREVLVQHYSQDAKILGVDVARYGDDRSVCFFRQGRKAGVPLVWKGIDLMTLASQVAQQMDYYEPDAVFIDQTGIGSGVVDRLRQLGRRVIGVDFGGKATDEKFQNKRAEMWWNLAKWMETASIPSLPELHSELAAVQYTYANAQGRLQLESKEDLKKRGLPSPDLADALALTFAEPVAHPGLRGVRRFTVHRAASA
jgi:hypothetical protein